MEQIDYKAQLKKFYKPASTSIEWVDVPAMNFIMIEGKGDPATSEEYKTAADILLSLSLTIKNSIKKHEAIDYGIMPLEILWDSPGATQSGWVKKTDGNWTAMIQQPTPVTIKFYSKALAELQHKSSLIPLPTIRFEALNEGRAAQVLHLGPMSSVDAVIKQLRDRIHTIHAKPIGKYHEIYLSDMRKAAPEKWKTIIRQPYQ